MQTYEIEPIFLNHPVYYDVYKYKQKCCSFYQKIC